MHENAIHISVLNGKISNDNYFDFHLPDFHPFCCLCDYRFQTYKELSIHFHFSVNQTNRTFRWFCKTISKIEEEEEEEEDQESITSEGESF